MTVPALQQSYADNDSVTMAARLRAEILDRPSSHLDVASGYLAVSAWKEVGAALQELSRFRLLLGKDWQMQASTTADQETDIALLVKDAVRQESEPPRLPIPDDAEAIAEFITFLRRGTVEVKAWRGAGFLHAKAYILNSSAGVGSANFTGPGFVTNRELVMWRQDDAVVGELSNWFTGLWESEHSTEYKQDLIDALSDTRFGGTEYQPYEVLIRTLAEKYGLDTPPSLEQATFTLKWFQTDAVFRLIKLLSAPARGALLADAVGLGKTYMALGVMHHFLLQQRQSVSGKPVLLIIPASLRRTWEAVLDEYNLSWAVDIVHVQAFRDDYDIEPHTGADLVIIDEAHRLRGGGIWWQKTIDLLQRSVAGGGNPRVLLLTATPVNTGIEDLTYLLRVITKNRRNVWAPEIPDFEQYLRQIEKADADPYPVLDRSMVRRSRSDVLRAYEERRTTDPYMEAMNLPTRRLGHESYQYQAGTGNEVFEAFDDVLPNLYLAPYDLERFRRADDGQPVDLDAEVPASSLAGLYMVGLLKRFESSLRAVSISLRRLDHVLELFARALQSEPPRVLDFAHNVKLRRLLEEEARDDDDRSAEPTESGPRFDAIVHASPLLEHPDDYDLDAIAEAVQADRDGIERLRASLPDESDDGKIDALVSLLTRPMAGKRIGLRDRRTLVFTQYRDTAEYLKQRLDAAAERDPRIGTVALLHGGSSPNQRDSIAKTFDPDELFELDAAVQGTELPRILVSTDVLAEGHNLQRAQAVVNYDMPWNPQIAVQRAGRIDRLNSPHDRVYLVSFLPEDNLEIMLGLVERLNQRFGLYKRLGLADEPITHLPADQVVGKSIEQLRRLFRDDDDILDEIEKTWTLGSTDYMRTPLEMFLRANAAEALKDIPRGVQSVKRLPADWPHGEGVFIAFTLGDGDEAESYWRFYPSTPEGWGPAMKDEVDIFRAIACNRGTPRATLAADQVPDGPGGVIDWGLLRSSAVELAADLTAVRNTARLRRGASERSARVRARILGVLGDAEPTNAVGDFLDRLEQVRVEDFDADNRYEQFMEQLRAVERADDLAEQLRRLGDVAGRGTDLFGAYERSMKINAIPSSRRTTCD